ncbi:hypothetical protein BDM02DRAFT_2747684 [Thelephora ganbajun]|uniref:Uncharacterized protein n=1 Tax=Thelephora ganbajun TaxID=370292 RepID=A0ACB6ZCU2_THEGA|nr:hypothetical protein BDM02DRAFT_2747684 [Thelephora ganbajun]
MANSPSPHSYHLFAVPTPLLETLTPRNNISSRDLTHQSQRAGDKDDTANIEEPSPRNPAITSTSTTLGRSCNVCQGASFANVDDQRNHFRSDWHRYNVKLRLNGKDAVGENEFTQLVEALEDSLSGLATLLSRATVKTRSRSPSPSSTRRNFPLTPLIWFHSPPSTQIGVYRAIFSSPDVTVPYLDQLREMQNCQEAEGKKWALFLVAGGHFAGAVVRVHRDRSKDNDVGKTKKGKPKKVVPDTEVILHKTFHRYTTRRKQGGSQSINDNAKGAAISAGAMLRRYGEQALRDDIRNLLQEWSDEVDQCERVWIRASVSNRRIFFDYEDPVLNKGDERLRTFPFPTRRPTQSELLRCLMELTKVKITHFTEEDLKAQDAAYLASLPKPKPVPVPVQPKEKPVQPQPPKLTKEEELLKDKWGRVLEMVSKGRLEALKPFWEKEHANLVGGGDDGVDIRIPKVTGEHQGQTILQVAASSGQEEVVQWLLEEKGADPTIDVPLESSIVDLDGVAPSRRRTAYDLASTKEVRNVFRRYAGSHPDKWDWFGAGRIPSALTVDQEEQRDEKKKVRRKGLKDKIKEREARQPATPESEPEPEVETKNVVGAFQEDKTGPRRLGGTTGDNSAVLGLTPEMKAKLERERRARAAEARMKALSGR